MKFNPSKLFKHPLREVPLWCNTNFKINTADLTIARGHGIAMPLREFMIERRRQEVDEYFLPSLLGILLRGCLKSFEGLNFMPVVSP